LKSRNLKSANEKGDSRKEFIDFVVDVKRVTKVTRGGKRFQFSAFVISGDGGSRIGIGKGKGRDVSLAVAKATARARRKLFPISTRNGTITYPVSGKHGSSYVILRPAFSGTGMIAGGAMRFVFKAAGISDVLSKSIGKSRSNVNLVKATLNALSKCRSILHIAKLRGKSPKEIVCCG
jgi:small subunit ribosomal protein S5